MKFPDQMMKGKFLRRYKRFFADIELETGEVVVAHCPNTGSMKTCIEAGWTAWVSYEDNPKRKLKYTLQVIEVGETRICVNTQLANKVVKEGIEKGMISELAGYDSVYSEAKYNEGTRFDFRLEKGCDVCYVEVKAVTLKGEGGRVMFPDAVTTRGQKHLRELMAVKRSGDRAVLILLVQRNDAEYFLPARHIDPEYASLVEQARAEGVEIYVYVSKITETSVAISNTIALKTTKGESEYAIETN